MLDVACGIGTQSIGLARKGFAVTGSDLSAGAVERAKVEARQRGYVIDLSVCDMRAAHDRHGRESDVEIACDNSIPHLLSDDEILMAYRQMRDCIRPGGCLVTHYVQSPIITPGLCQFNRIKPDQFIADLVLRLLPALTCGIVLGEDCHNSADYTTPGGHCYLLEQLIIDCIGVSIRG